MTNYIPKSKKSPNVQRLINEALDILGSVGVTVNGKSERALESMAMSFLAVAGVSKSWPENKNFKQGRRITTREIIKFINEHFEENISSGSYDDIRRKHLRPLLSDNLVINIGKNEDASSNDPTRGYSLEEDFEKVINFYKTKQWNQELEVFLEERKPFENIPEIHNNAFDFLANWSDNNSSSLINRFFFLRTREDELFKQGYWFPGDNNYLAISFWTGETLLIELQIYIFKLISKKELRHT